MLVLGAKVQYYYTKLSLLQPRTVIFTTVVKVPVVESLIEKVGWGEIIMSKKF